MNLPIPTNQCLRCGGDLDPGFIEDAGQASQGRARWIPGPIETGLLGGTKRIFKERHDIVALRCSDCGKLELRVE
jgi:hypothetical protein